MAWPLFEIREDMFPPLRRDSSKIGWNERLPQEDVGNVFQIGFVWAWEKAGECVQTIRMSAITTMLVFPFFLSLSYVTIYVTARLYKI